MLAIKKQCSDVHKQSSIKTKRIISHFLIAVIKSSMSNKLSVIQKEESLSMSICARLHTHTHYIYNIYIYIYIHTYIYMHTYTYIGCVL